MKFLLFTVISALLYYSHGFSFKIPLRQFKSKQYVTQSDHSHDGARYDLSAVNGLKKLVAALTIGLSVFGGAIHPSLAAEPTILTEVWGMVNENFVDSTFNGNNWNEIKEDYSNKVRAGADERELTIKMLSKLGDKYSRLIDKTYFESLWKFDAIGIGLIFQSYPGSPMVVSAPPIGGSSSEKAGFKKGDIIYQIKSLSSFINTK